MNLKMPTKENISRNVLGSFSKIYFGHYIKDLKKEGVSYLQARNFDHNGIFLNNIDSFIEEESVQDKMLLNHGDIIFVSKGMKFFAYMYDMAIGPAVASSIFYIIKADRSIVDPGFLTLILNSTKSLNYFNQSSSGATIPSIRKSEIEDYEIPLPPLAIQNALANIYKLHKEEIRLLQDLIKSKHRFINQITNNIIH